MNLFRSEEHVRRWLGGREGGATISVTALSELAEAWLVSSFIGVSVLSCTEYLPTTLCK